MTTSESINEIATALAKAQGEMSGAVKDAANPFFKSKYADLASVWDACRTPLATNGLAVVQSPEVADGRVLLETLLVHTSGQWIRNSLTCSVKDDSPQTIGSATTYLRRYALQSLVGVAAEDDDAEAAQGRNSARPTASPVAAPAPKGYDEWMTDLAAVTEEGTAKLQAAWKASKADLRTYLTTHHPKVWEGLKLRASQMDNDLVSA
jgi:hypothetical protein